MSTNCSESSNNQSADPALYTSLASSDSSFFDSTFNPAFIQKFLVRICPILVLCTLLLLLAACGPENRSTDQSSLRAEAQRIANAYVANPNLDQASAELEALDVSNINQWFKYTAEDAITGTVDPNDTRALVQLAIDLGIRSSTIDRFGIQAGLLEEPPAVEIVAPAIAAPDQSSASVIGAVNAAENAIENATQNADTGENSAEDTSDQDASTARSIELVPITTEAQSGENLADENLADESSESVTAVDAEPAADANTESNDEVAIAEEAAIETESVELVPADPIAVANAGMNVRAGPGLTYAVISALQPGETGTVIGKNPLGDWWQVKLPTGVTGWLFRDLTSVNGSTDGIAVAANIPPPPTASPVPPTPIPTPTFTYAPPPTVYVPPTAPPIAAPPPTPVPAPTAAPAPAPEKPAGSGNTFTLIERRLWGVQENGGFLAGDSVNCGDKRELWVEVIDAAGNPINGVTVHGVYTKVDVVTGAQGKGDGRAEYVLGDGEDIRILRDTDGSEASSDKAVGMVTKPHLIDFPSLIQAGYCKDDASCKTNVVDPYACGGHYSWTVKFQRNY